MTDLLPSLLKAGGIAALAIGVVYLLYREIIKLGIVPILKQWQGFTLLAGLAVLVFIITMTALLHRANEQALLDGELPPNNHFQVDSRDGVFSEKKNVYQPFVSFFDSIDINLSDCNGLEGGRSNEYCIYWQPEKPKDVKFAQRRGFDQCFVSDFAQRAPAFLQNVQSTFEKIRGELPCKTSLYMMRQIRISYIDLRNQSREVAFIQFYNRGGTGNFEIEQVGTTNLARSDQMETLVQEANGGVAPDRLLAIARSYGFTGVPKSTTPNPALQRSEPGSQISSVGQR